MCCLLVLNLVSCTPKHVVSDDFSPRTKLEKRDSTVAHKLFDFDRWQKITTLQTKAKEGTEPYFAPRIITRKRRPEEARQRESQAQKCQKRPCTEAQDPYSGERERERESQDRQEGARDTHYLLSVFNTPRTGQHALQLGRPLVRSH